MKVIASDRRSGKTLELIELCHNAEASGEVGYIVCHNEREAHRIAKCADIMGKKIAFPITYTEFLTMRYHGPNIKNFYIDNVEMLVCHLTTVRVSAITVTTNSED